MSVVESTFVYQINVLVHLWVVLEQVLRLGKKHKAVVLYEE